MELHQNYQILEGKQTAYAGEEEFRLVSAVKKRENPINRAKPLLVKLRVKLHGRSPGNSLAPDYTSEEQEEAEGR